jgi:hypothetical protein
VLFSRLTRLLPTKEIDAFPLLFGFLIFFVFFMLLKPEKGIKECYSTVEETSVGGKKTSSKVQGTYLCSMQGSMYRIRTLRGCFLQG